MQAAPAAAAERAQSTPAAAIHDSLQAVAAQLESYLRSNGRTLDFSVDEPTGRAVITVRDSQSGDVIRQIPSEEALRLAHALGTNSNALIDLIV